MTAAYCPNCAACHNADLTACPECWYPVPAQSRAPITTTPVRTSSEATILADGGRCGVLVVRRCGRVLETHTRSWTLQAWELNGRRNGLISELLWMGPGHPNYLRVLAQIQELEARRLRAREGGL